MSSKKLDKLIATFLETVSLDIFESNTVNVCAKLAQQNAYNVLATSNIIAQEKCFDEVIKFALQGKLLAQRQAAVLKNSIKETWYISRGYDKPVPTTVYKTTDGKVLDTTLKEISVPSSRVSVVKFHSYPIFPTIEEAYNWTLRLCTHEYNKAPNSNQNKQKLEITENSYKAYLARENKLKVTTTEVDWGQNLRMQFNPPGPRVNREGYVFVDSRGNVLIDNEA